MTPFPTHSLFSVLFSLFSILVVGFSMFSRRILEILPGRFGFSSVFSVVGVLDSRFSILGSWVLDSRLDSPRSFWILDSRFSVNCVLVFVFSVVVLGFCVLVFVFSVVADVAFDNPGTPCPVHSHHNFC